MLRHFKQMEMNASCALLGTEDRVYTLAYFMHAFTTKDTHTHTRTHTHTTNLLTHTHTRNFI